MIPQYFYQVLGAALLCVGIASIIFAAIFPILYFDYKEKLAKYQHGYESGSSSFERKSAPDSGN